LAVVLCIQASAQKFTSRHYTDKHEVVNWSHAGLGLYEEG